MRVFWMVISILLVAGAAVLLSETADDTQVGATTVRSEAAATPAVASAAIDAPAIPPPAIDLGSLGGVDADAATAVPLLVDRRSPLEITRRIDSRTLELDGRYRLVGNGTSDDPYRISWELLTSASQYVDPARDALGPPPWVRAIDGTFVEISAYYSSAVRVQFARHLLLTLNRWDGCCIGLPPTPFDAIDVSMREPVSMGGLHLVRFGTFRGRLVVEPLQVAGYLIGLYRLEDAVLEVR